ncbi:MAG: hypothetical protein WA130_20020 [Candidatus Methanoperedens sp.]
MSIVLWVSPAGSTLSNAIPMDIVTGLAIGGVPAIILLILLISSKDILLSSKYRNDENAGFLNIMILPLLIVFTSIVIFKIIEIV